MDSTAMVCTLALMAGLGCAATAPSATAPSAPASSSAAAAASASERCQMALAALDAVVKRWDEQPLGLDRACVDRVAASRGKIHADARFTIADQVQILPEAGCANCCGDARFAVRFGPSSTAASPTPEVVLLTLWSQLPAAWDFNAVVDVDTWPTRRPGAAGLPVCGAAFGILRRPADAWIATVLPPPRSRAQLELGR
jgi:hypothetical protein